MQSKMLAALMCISPASSIRTMLDGDAQAATADAKDLRVFATTFNAGNRVYEESKEFEELAYTLLRGHDSVAEEADIVFMGFQEFEDDKYKFANMVRDGKMWKQLGQNQMNQLKEDMERAATPSPEVAVAKESLQKAVADFHDLMSQQLEKLNENFGPGAEEFHSNVAEKSAVNELVKDEPHTAAGITEDIDGRTKKFEEVQASAAERFVPVQDAVGEFAEKTKIPVHTDEALAPLREWTAKALQDLQAVRAKYPNLAYSSKGEQIYQQYLNRVNNINGVVNAMKQKDKQSQQATETHLNGFAFEVKRQVERSENDVAAVIKADLERVKRDVYKLSEDVKKDVEGGKLHATLKQSAASAANGKLSKLREALKSWRLQHEKSVKDLLESGRFDVKHDHVEVTMTPQKWNSGVWCSAGSHYDTVMYAFVNPFSKWRLSPVEYSSKACVKRDEGSQNNPGCNMDFNEGVECGKVVNLMVFMAQHGQNPPVRVCAMNTHMSFGGSAKKRMGFITKALQEAQSAQCDSVFFVGDFNTRLHCESGMNAQDLPPFERSQGSENSQDWILDKYCDNLEKGKCTLTSRDDELTQFLEAAQIRCYETESVHKPGTMFGSMDVWKITPFGNTVAPFSVREADHPDFLPTYKMGTIDCKWQHCGAADERCFCNPSGKGKHNPAWTDRIIMRSANKQVQLETKEYLRSKISDEFRSDHAPVIARVTMKISQ